jgi:UPF0271 protein
VADIDLDADLGEGFGVWRLGDNDAMLGIVTSANVACGFHAANPASLLRVCRAPAERSVRIGAQLSYRDLAGFGRRFADVAAEDQGAAVAEAVHRVDATLPVLGMAGSASFDEAARLGLRTVAEAFADRAYRPDGQLVPRREPGAVLHDPAAIADRVVTMVTSGQVTAIDGTQIAVSVESVCVHGDSPGAVQIATAVRDQLKTAGIDTRAFC